MNIEDLDTMFNLPLSQQAFQELEQLGDVIALQGLDDQTKDSWSYQWGSSTYSSRKFYKMVFQNVPAHPVFQWLWKSMCTLRVKFFAWLVLIDRLNTKTMLKRRHMSSEDEPQCVTCSEGIDEDIKHLFFACNFVESCWERIGIHWNMDLSLHLRIAQTAIQPALLHGSYCHSELGDLENKE